MDNPGNFFAANKDGSFAYFNHGDITASFIKYSKSQLVMIISDMTKIKIRVELFAVAPEEAEMQDADGELIKGEGLPKSGYSGQDTVYRL